MMESKQIDCIKGRIKLGKTVVYPVSEVISYLKRKVVSQPKNPYLENMYKRLEEKNATGFVSRKDLEIQTGGLLKSRTLANIDSLNNRILNEIEQF